MLSSVVLQRNFRISIPLQNAFSLNANNSTNSSNLQVYRECGLLPSRINQNGDEITCLFCEVSKIYFSNIDESYKRFVVMVEHT